MWFPCGVSFFFSFFFFWNTTPPVRTAGSHPQHFWNAFKIYLFGKTRLWFLRFFWRVCVCVCSPLQQQIRWRPTLCSGKSTGVSMSQYSQPNQHQSAETDGCLFSRTGGQWKIRRSFGTESFFFFYLLKEALTGAHTILGNVFPSISSLSALVSPHSFLPFSSFSSLSRAPPPALASLPPLLKDPPFSRSVPSLTLFKPTSDCHIWSPPHAADSLIRGIVHVELW